MLLRKDDPWPKGLEMPDVRDWRVIDADDRAVGFVQSVVIDRAENRVDAVLTGASDRHAAADVDVEEGILRINRSLEKRSDVQSPDQPAQKRGFEDAFRSHYERAYEGQDRTYDSLRGAYRFGRVMALDADYSRRSFARAEEDLRAEYVTQRLKPPFGVVRAAVRHGYDLAQNLERYRASSMDREGDQLVAEGEQSADRFLRAGSAMDTGSPPEEDREVVAGK